MPVVICNSESQLSKHIPSTLSELRLADLYVNINTDNRYIQGQVKWRGQLLRTKHRTLIKTVIEQDDVLLTVFFLEKFAEDVQIIAVGDLLVCSAVTVESNTRPSDLQSSCQIVVDQSLSKPNIWIFHKTGVNTGNNGQGVIESTSTVSGVDLGNQSSAVVRTYQYTRLSQIKVQQTVNMFGVVKYLKPPSKTCGSDYSMFISIVDDSSTVKLKCMIFARNEQMLPPVEKLGEIVRFHRMKITEFNEELQGQGNCCFGFSCLVFSGDVGSPLTPKSVSTTYTCTDKDLKRVCELREWLAGSDSDVLSQNNKSDANQFSSSTKIKFKDCSTGQFFDLTCQVIGICPLSTNSLLLKVWDGTCPKFVHKQEDLSNSEYIDWLCMDESLNAEAGRYAVDIYVFDEHVGKASKIKSCDYIKLKNLHAAIYQKNNPTTSHEALPLVEFMLHGGGASFGRSIIILDDTDPEMMDIKQQLAVIASSGDISQDADSSITLVQDCQNPEQRHGEVCDPPLDDVFSFGSENICMLNTATVLTSNHNQQTSTIKDVIQEAAPHKFRLLCRIKDFSPKANRPEDLIKLYCKRCHYMSSLPMVCDVNSSATTLAPVFYKRDKQLNLYTCPRCIETISDRCLEYTLMLQLLLYDNTGWIVAGLWREEAVKFFQNTTAAELLLEDQSFKYVMTHILKLIQTDPSSEPNTGLRTVVDQSPLVECCVKSYIAMGGVCYQIFDTCLTRSNTDN